MPTFIPELAATPSAPRTLFFLHSGDDLYGSDIVLLDLVCSLDRTRFSPWVLLPADSAHVGKLSAELARYGVPCRHFAFPVLRRRYFTPLGGLRYLWETAKSLRQMRTFARQQNAALIHTNTLAVPFGALLARSLRLPHVWHIHEILVKPSFLPRLLHRFAVRSSDAVVCISEAVRAHVAKDVPAAKLLVIPNGIRPIAFSDESPSTLRAALDLLVEPLLIGTLGRISAWKGQTVLAEAAALLRQSGYNAHFLVMGGVFDGDLRPLQALEEVIREHHLESTFSIRGFRPDARNLLRALDIFVLPSILPEPFGLVVTEAMAAGLPVVATDQGGPREIVVHETTGLLVPPNDPRALADALASLLDHSDTRRQYGEAGRTRLIEHFSLQLFVDRFSNLYSTCLTREQAR